MLLFRVNAMYFSGARKRLRLRRAISALALLFVFFLPLHFHFSIPSQLTKECSCVHGTRTQLALDADPPTITPTLSATVFAILYDFSWAGDWSKPQNVRGPPVSLSI
jgi:hypothetical protein